MEKLNSHIKEYRIQLKKGHIQKAYLGIMKFMSLLNRTLKNQYLEFSTGALYYGFMDMTYFAFTPKDLKENKLKIAIVYLHQEGRFEVWLSGVNRTIQDKYISLLQNKKMSKYKLSKVQPGVDSIVEGILVENPDFDQPMHLIEEISIQTLNFINDMRNYLR